MQVHRSARMEGAEAMTGTQAPITLKPRNEIYIERARTKSFALRVFGPSRLLCLRNCPWMRYNASITS